MLKNEIRFGDAVEVGRVPVLKNMWATHDADRLVQLRWRNGHEWPLAKKAFVFAIALRTTGKSDGDVRV